MESIHTGKQLDVLLRSNRNDDPIDLNASQSYLSSIWSVFDLNRSGGKLLNNSYQLSEELSEETNANTCKSMPTSKLSIPGGPSEIALYPSSTVILLLPATHF
uniref:Uncharacterized protein n=1 Tax=Caenorhabditis japonica TaxID=281687 RepID=A0A8R1IN67_CAEJA